MWTISDWSQRHIDKDKLASKLAEMGITVLGWSNRKPELTREDGKPIDWDKVEDVARKLFLSRPKPKPTPEPEAEPKKVEKKPVKKSRSRKRTAKKSK